MSFNKLVKLLTKFQLELEPVSEKEIEINLLNYLQKNKITTKRQEKNTKFRNDLVVIMGKKRYCIELKVVADVSVAKQLDDYLPFFKDGIVLVCYKASKLLRQIFTDVQQKINTPIQLIEIRKNQDII